MPTCRPSIRHVPAARHRPPLTSDVGGDPKLAEAPQQRALQLRGYERMEPPVVLARNQVKRPTDEPTDDELPVGEGGIERRDTGRVAAGADREPEAAEILSLDRQQPGRHRKRRRRFRPRK
jgi:hypothetical protein